VKEEGGREGGIQGRGVSFRARASIGKHGQLAWLQTSQTRPQRSRCVPQSAPLNPVVQLQVPLLQVAPFRHGEAQLSTTGTGGGVR
jgi:hypothetical protein